MVVTKGLLFIQPILWASPLSSVVQSIGDIVVNEPNISGTYKSGEVDFAHLL